jgi:branched-subunit amino acid aminotransferase/4-amino-4-deoxychorismate lyase
MHTFPLPFQLWSDKYAAGQRLVTTDVEQVPASSWPPELKCRSRMHYYLADRYARNIDPQARGLLLDRQGYVVEASTANVIVYVRDEGLVSPPRASILPGVSLAFLEELAGQLGLAFTYRDLSISDVAEADEVLLSSTSPCLLPVVSFNGRPVGTGKPGEVLRRCLHAWGRHVGVDIPGQAERFRERT